MACTPLPADRLHARRSPSPSAVLTRALALAACFALTAGLGVARGQQRGVSPQGQPKGGNPMFPKTPQEIQGVPGVPGPTAGEETDWMTYLMILGGAVVVIGIVAAVMKQQEKKKNVAAPTHAADMVGGYRLQNLMMTGQTSQVWEAVEATSGRHFAIKMLLPEKANEQEHRRLLFHEAEVGIKLAHPNVIKIVKLEKLSSPPYFVMEFFPAGNLKVRIMHKKWDFIKEKGSDIFKQAATALAYMNASGWVHRDVKPDNIMVNSAGEVRIIDFALAQRIGAGGGGLFKKKGGRTAGTRSYMSPEQIRGLPLDGRADVYSFGATLYETVTGRPPFRAASPTELLNKHFTEKPVSPQVHNPDVTDEFSALVLRMLAKKKEDRPKDFHEVLMALRGMRIFKSPPSTTGKAADVAEG